ncbi:MAG: enoyl-CoA hydratase-related protein, partial [Ginsengibacter sp.]
MDYSTLQTALENSILTITVNRPEKLNALNKMVLDELDRAIDNVYSDDKIKGAIITGAGEKAFVAGADIAEFVAAKNDEGMMLAQKGQDIFFKIENCPKPVIAA